jgi:hypothetical protein
MSRFASILLCAMLAAPQVSAEIFKCVRKDGLDLYQNFPCQFESIGGAAMNVQALKTPSAPSNSSPPNTKMLTAGAISGAKSSSAQAEPRIGMTTEEVRLMWGEPVDTLQEEPGEGGRSEVWSYGDSRSVRFDHRGRVLAIHR